MVLLAPYSWLSSVLESDCWAWPLASYHLISLQSVKEPFLRFHCNLISLVTCSMQTCQRLFENPNEWSSGSLLSTCCWHPHKTLTHQWPQISLPESPAASFSRKTLFTYGSREFTPYCRLYHLTRNGQPSQSAVSRIPSRNFAVYGSYAGNQPGLRHRGCLKW